MLAAVAAASDAASATSPLGISNVVEGTTSTHTHTLLMLSYKSGNEKSQ